MPICQFFSPLNVTLPNIYPNFKLDDCYHSTMDGWMDSRFIYKMNEICQK